MSNQYRSKFDPRNSPEMQPGRSESQVPEQPILSARDFTYLPPEPEIRTFRIDFFETTEGSHRAMGQISICVPAGGKQPLIEIPAEFL